MLPIIKKYKKRLILLVAVLLIYIVTIFCYGYKIPWFDKHPDWGYFPQHTNPNIVIEEIYHSVDFETVIPGENTSLIFGFIKGEKYDSLVIFNDTFKLLYKSCVLGFDSYRFSNPLFFDTNLNCVILPLDRKYSKNKSSNFFALNVQSLHQVILPDNYTIRTDTIDEFNIDLVMNSFHKRNKKMNNISLLEYVITKNEFHPGSTLGSFNYSLNTTGYVGLEKRKEYWSYFSQEGIGYFEISLGGETVNYKLKNEKDLHQFFQFNTGYKNSDTLYIKSGRVFKIYRK